MVPTEILLALVPLFVIVDPFASMGLFLGLTEGRDTKQRNRIAMKASIFAAIVLILFAAVGSQALGALGIQLYSLKIAGGLLLVMIGLRMLREGREVPHREMKQHDLPTGGSAAAADLDDPSFVPLGLPMLAGPGAISLVIVQSTDYGISIVAAAVAITMLSAFVILGIAARMHVFLGDTGSRVITRIMGILTVAFAVQFVLDGIVDWQAFGGVGGH